MMDVPLTSWQLLTAASRHAADTEIVTRLPDGGVHRYRYAALAARAHQLMHALDGMGLDRGDRVATLAWNGYRHLEAYLGVPCSGRVLHTLNLRLSPEDLAYIIDHAGDRVILVDADQVPLLEKVQALGGLRTVERVVVLGELASTTLPGATAYEDLIADEPAEHAPVAMDEREPMSVCYTSGTTGRPKGVVSTHRSTVLHALATTSAAALGIGPGDCVLPVVPMFHAGAWGLPYAAALVGAKQVFLGGSLDPVALVDLLDGERVTVSAGVPTVWHDVAEALAARGGGLPALRHLGCGGSRPPRAMIRRYAEDFGVRIVQLWGMTETSPLATAAWPMQRMAGWGPERLLDAVATQAGTPLPLVEVSIRDESGREVPWDGATMGVLHVRGPWVASGYLGGDGAESWTGDGWFVTGDVAIGTPEGYLSIADRTKDLIKSGGEWISSIDMESALVAMPEVAEAAVIAVPDLRWQERPLACIVPHDHATPTLPALRRHLEQHGFAAWQLPDRMELLTELPRTGVGKYDKLALRARFGGA